MEIFDSFDRILYKDNKLTNILRKTEVIKQILDKIDVYHEYVIKDRERADTIAYDYYGSATYAWLIYVTNDILDPYYQWPLTNRQFYDFIVAKYGSYQYALETTKDWINPNYNFSYGIETIENLTDDEKSGWNPQTYYEYEYQQNENRRNIKLISNRYTNEIDSQVRSLFKWQ